MSVQSSVLGFPRIGALREVKKAVESCMCLLKLLGVNHRSCGIGTDWGDKSSAEDLQKVAKEVRLAKYKTIKDAGVDIIPR